MIGFVIVTHGRLGSELINTAELILGRLDHCVSVSIDAQSSPETIRAEIGKAIRNTDLGSGVLILTDMFGGTPSNFSLSFLEKGRVEVLTGVNLPMIIKLIQSRDKMVLSELAETIGAYGRKSINVAGEILHRRQKK